MDDCFTLSNASAFNWTVYFGGGGQGEGTEGAGMRKNGPVSRIHAQKNFEILTIAKINCCQSIDDGMCPCRNAAIKLKRRAACFATHIICILCQTLVASAGSETSELWTPRCLSWHIMLFSPSTFVYVDAGFQKDDHCPQFDVQCVYACNLCRQL